MKYIRTYEENTSLKENDIIIFTRDVKGKNGIILTAFKPYTIIYVYQNDYAIEDNFHSLIYIDKNDKDFIHVKNVDDIEIIKNSKKYNI